MKLDGGGQILWFNGMIVAPHFSVTVRQALEVLPLMEGMIEMRSYAFYDVGFSVVFLFNLFLVH